MMSKTLATRLCSGLVAETRAPGYTRNEGVGNELVGLLGILVI